MAFLLHELPYEKWVAFIFNRPVTDPLWFTDPHAPLWPQEMDRLRRMDYLGRLFRQPRERLGDLNVDQIGVGFWYLINHTLGDYLGVVADLSMPWALRQDGIASIEPLFQYFASIFDEEPLQRARVGYWPKVTCQMFWDVCALWPDPTNAQQRESDELCLGVMKRSLGIEHSIIHGAALHGLGLWSRAYPKQVGEIIDGFLAANPGLSEELQDYAQKAKMGLVS